MYSKLKPAAKYLLLLSLFSACCKTKPQSANNTVKKVIDDHFKYLNTHDLHALRTQYTDKATIISPVMEGYKYGPLGADEVFHFTFLLSGNSQYLVNNIMTTDSTAVVQYEVRGSKTRENPNVFLFIMDAAFSKLKTGKLTANTSIITPKPR